MLLLSLLSLSYALPIPAGLAPDAPPDAPPADPAPSKPAEPKPAEPKPAATRPAPARSPASPADPRPAEPTAPASAAAATSPNAAASAAASPRPATPAAASPAPMPATPATASAAASPAAAASTAPVPQGSLGTLRFDRDLGIGADAMLEGLDATRTIPFSLPRGWALQDDPLLTLGFDHSASLMGTRSSLTVRLNDRAVGSIPLEPSNSADGALQVRLPRALLQDYNTLQLTAVQHVTGPCEDPYDPSLWTRVRSDSRIDVARVAAAPVADLGRFPLPFIDTLDPEPARLALVGTGATDADGLRAIGRLGVGIGRAAGYRSAVVAPPVAHIGDLASNGLLIGVVGRDAELTAAVQAAHPEPLAAGTGFVAEVPTPDGAHLVLVVAGADAAGLRLATDALLGQDRAPVLSGTAMVVTKAPVAAPPPNRDAFHPAPPTPGFTLGDLGLTDRTVRGLYTEPVTVPLDLEGDALPSDDAELELHYAHSDPVDARVSAVEVRLNGVVLRSHPLDSGEAPTTLRVELPRAVLAPRNTLEIAFHLVPKDFDACRDTGFRQLWATVLADSTLRVPRDRWAMMPDLGRLANAFWPFSVDPAAGGTGIVLPAQPTAAEASAALQMAAALGRASTAAEPALEVGTADAMPAGRQRVLLAEAGHAHGTLDPLVASGVLGVTSSGPDDAVEEAMDPAQPGQALLWIHGADLAAAVRSATGLERVGQLSGNAAALPADGRPRPFDVGPRVAVGTRSTRSALAGLLLERWPALGAALLVAALVAANAIRRWARARGGST